MSARAAMPAGPTRSVILSAAHVARAYGAPSSRAPAMISLRVASTLKADGLAGCGPGASLPGSQVRSSTMVGPSRVAVADAPGGMAAAHAEAVVAKASAWAEMRRAV